MLAPLVGIGKIVLELPEIVAVLLIADGVLAAYPAAEVDHRLVSVGIRFSHIETELCSPCYMFYRSKFSVDVSAEFLSLEENLIHHRKCDRVR